MYGEMRQSGGSGSAFRGRRPATVLGWLLLVLAALAARTPPVSAAGDTVCAEVRIEIVQELSLERQGFEASMRINNGLDTLPLENVRVDVRFTDENGDAVLASSDPNDPDALFFIRISAMEGIADVSGGGVVAPGGQADIRWLIVPAPGASGGLPDGKLYYVGATLSYLLGGEQTVTEVSPDYIFVKPMPLLALDYFLPRDVIGDDAFTPEIEPPEPFTLGVRIRNNGVGPARNVRIGSAQPRIVENDLGLLIDFRILGSYVDDAPAEPSLLIDFGEVPANGAAMGRWNMITTLSGQFTEFTAEFTHSDELGGQLTSLLDSVTTHTLVHDVLVDLPGRDAVRDFLAQDGLLRVYESSGVDTEVADVSSGATLTLAGQNGTELRYTLSVPPEAGFLYARVRDPSKGGKRIVRVERSDGKRLLPENAWSSKTRVGSQPWDYWLNLFDFGSTGSYTLVLDDPVAEPQAPVLQFIPDRSAAEGRQISFLVEASDPDGTPPVLTATGLPAGANFVDQGNGTAVFDWTPAEGQAGVYPIRYQASDGVLSRSQVARIVVNPAWDSDGDGVADAWELENFGTLDRDLSLDSDGDGVSDFDEYQQGTDPLGLDGALAPMIDAPWYESEVASVQPVLSVLNAQHPRPGTPLAYEFELYADAGYRSLIEASGPVAEGAERTAWTPTAALPDNRWAYWRVRAHDGTLYTPWVYASFFVNVANEAPLPFALSQPADGTQAAALPELQVGNSVDPDGDAVSYRFELFADAGLGSRLAASPDVPADPAGVTRWTPATALDPGTYYWRVTATDEHGLATPSAVGTFRVDDANTPPAPPVIAAPAGAVAATDLSLVVDNASDADGDALAYRFELDTRPAFDGPARQVSAWIGETAGSTAWPVTGLVEDEIYYWRAKASDGVAESPWVYGEFRVNTLNGAPGAVVPANPADGAWLNLDAPRLSVLPAGDPDGDPLRYRFELYRDGALSDLAAAGTSATPAWSPGAALADHGWYYWRARAEDAALAGPWSAVGAFYVNTGGILFAADINRDGRVDARDLGRMMSEWASGGPGSDLTGDGSVGARDLRQLLEQLNR